MTTELLPSPPAPVLPESLAAHARSDLPHGTAPSSLADVSSFEVEAELIERALALSVNARDSEEQSPLTAAICWNETGRMLAGRGGRPAEAWLCHSRALAISPEFQPARQALRRLAIRAGDPVRLAEILDAEIERATDDLEIAALLTERAAAEAAIGRTAAALGSLRDAARARPKSLVARLLHLSMAAHEVDEAELADSLKSIVEAWPASDDARGLRLMLALFEERLGRLDEAAARIAGGDSFDDGTAPADTASAWTAARLALRTSRHGVAATILGSLARALGDEDPDSVTSLALKRFESMVRALHEEADDTSAAVLETDSSETVAESELVAALRAADPARERRALRACAATAATPALQAALLTSAAATRLADAPDDTPLEEGLGAMGLQGRVLARLLAPQEAGHDERQRANDRPQSDILEALGENDASRIAAVLDHLEDLGTDEDERWTLAVAGAWLREDRLGLPEEAIRALSAASDGMDRAPLPRLIRAAVIDRSVLAELAIVEADRAADPAAAALKLAWAGHHLATIDPARSVELHRRALEMDPTCPVSLAGLARGTIDHEALAEAHVAAAAAAAGDDRFRHLLLTGAHRVAMGARDQARAIFCKALELQPGDADLWVALLRLAIDDPPDLAARIPSPPAGGESLPARLHSNLGCLALEQDPSQAIDAFATAAALDPADPIALHGHFEALLAGGRGSIVSARLLDELGKAEDERERAGLLLRLAEIDSRQGRDLTSAVLSWLSVFELLPGHRPTLCRLLFHFARHGRHDDLSRVLAAAARTLEDDGDGAALAQIAWQGTAADLDLLRLAVARGARTPIHLTLLEALSESPAERLELLERIATETGEESPTMLARVARLREETGDREGAIEALGRLLHKAPDDIAALTALLGLQRDGQDLAGAATTLAALSRASRVPALRLEYLLEEARVAHQDLGDARRAAACCEEALAIDPINEGAYTTGRALFEELHDQAGLSRVLALRISGLEQPAAKHGLLLELAELRLSLGESDQAKVALGLAIELAPNDIATRRRLAALHMADKEWDGAIEHLMEAARFNRDPQAGQEIFFELGVLYADRTDRADLAEKSFVKVLGWNRGHFAAMERLADLYTRTGNWQRAAQALEQLVAMTDAPPVKAAKLAALAAVLDTRMDRPKDAERLLNEARAIEPLGVGPIRGLAELYTRQRDAMALNVLLDQALAGHSAALEEDPDRPALYANLYGILEMKTEDSLASLATGVLDLLGARGDYPEIPPDVVEVHWQGGARAGDPSLAEFYCPKAIPPGLRETLRTLEDPIARSLGASSRQVDLPRDSRIDRKHPLAMMLSLLGPAFGIRQEIVCHAVATPRIGFAPGSPGIALVPRQIAGCEDQSALAFAAGTILAFAREGLSLATVVPEERLRRIVAGVVKLAVPGFIPAGIDPAALEEEVAFLRRTVPDKLIARVAPFAFECQSSLERLALGKNLLTIADRLGLMTCGSLTGALSALAMVHERPVAPLSLLPGCKRMISFAFSKDHVELRRHMGI